MRNIGKEEKSLPSRQEVIKEILQTADNLTSRPEYIKGIVWSEHAMKVVLAAKEERRRNKELPFNYLVTQFKLPKDTTSYSLEENKEIFELFRFLSDNLKKLPAGLRFQLAVLIDGHWTCVDNLITPQGISAFNLDAVMDSRSRHFFLIYVTNFQQAHLLNASYIYYTSVPSEGVFAKTPKEKVANMIQTDFVSCGIFVVDHLSFLSRTNVFHHLKSSFGQEEYKMLSRADIPPSLSAIFRLGQSTSLFSGLSSKQAKATVSRKGKKLEAIRGQSASESPDMPSILSNAMAKGDKILKQANDYVANCSTLAYENIFSHNLCEQLSAYVKNYSASVNDLISFIYKGLPECKRLDEEKSIKLMETLHQVILMSELNDSEKIVKIVNLTRSSLENLNDLQGYRLLAAILSYAALNITDNQQLWDFYKTLQASSLYKNLNVNTNSFFNIATQFTPALASFVERSIRTQLYHNAVSTLKDGNDAQLKILELTEVASFLKSMEPQIMSKIINLTSKTETAQRTSESESLLGQLNQRKQEVLSEFHFDVTKPSVNTTNLPH